LLNVVCTANPKSVSNEFPVRVHEGLLSIGEALLSEILPFIDLTSPEHRVVFTGHSIGGSLSVLLMILLTVRRGVQSNVLRVFSFGGPPIFELPTSADPADELPVLEHFGLASDTVFAYNQPWDPITRLFSKFDPLYPLIDDLGSDGYSLFASGPSRTLRPILKAILESWDGWPEYRDNARYALGQNFTHVGVHFILLPEPIRYLTDKLVSANTAVPEVDSVIQISNEEILPALDEVFTLDVFLISYVSVAIRSFVHHFYPAYVGPFIDYAKNVKEGRLR